MSPSIRTSRNSSKPFTLEQTMKAQRGVELYSSSLSLTVALDGCGWSTLCPARFTHREWPTTYCTGGWVGPSSGLQESGKSLENLAPTRI